MRIEGYFHGALPFVRAAVFGTAIRRPLPVHFLIDTGATRTVINERDAEWLMVDRSRLRRSRQSVVGFGGRVDTWIIPGVELSFELQDGRVHLEQFSELMTLTHGVRNRALRRELQRLPSVLGQDVLGRYMLIHDRPAGRVLIADEEVRDA